MDYTNLENLTKSELVEITTELGIASRRKKSDIIGDIRVAKHENYRLGEQLGESGKDATTYSVKVGRKSFAMKQFKSRKSVKRMTEEADLQIRAADIGISPKIYDVDTEHKYIVMDKLDKHLVDVQGEKIISREHQKQLIQLYDKLDVEGIFHGDANPLNYMIKGKKLFVIDFGMSKKITPQLERKFNTSRPNVRIMTLGMILKFKKMGYPETSYEYLIGFISDEIRHQFGL